MNAQNPEQARILIVDHDAACLALYQKALSRLGFHNLLLLQDSTEIIERLPKFRPDLVITDLDMPILNGICVVSIVRETTPADEFLPVLVVTGHASAEAKHEALAAGAADFLLKPCDLAELHARVRNLLRIRALQQQTQAHSRELERTVSKRTHALGKALTDLKETQRMMLQEERLRAFAQMAGSIGHDFHQALQTVTSCSQTLLNKPGGLQDPEEIRKALTTIQTVADDAAAVVDRMRELYQAHDAKQEIGRVDLNDVIRDAVKFTQPKWHGLALVEGREIHVDLDLAPDAVIRGRPTELREMITNLLCNAVDAMPAGGTITCGAHRRGGQIVIEIVDQGIGMSAEVRERCLTPLFTTKGIAGTGLGLSIVSTIVQRHEGTLEIQSAPEAGTRVRIELPAEAEEEKAAVEAMAA